MKKKVRFFKQDGKWYADVPGHTLEENEMVMGADIALDFLSNGSLDELTILFSDNKKDADKSYLNLNIKSHEEDGAYYTVSGRLLEEFLDFAENVFCSDYGQEVWICNVIHDVFGEHPEFICILNIG